MEIKHTVEILTKDIQEIEKLVRNLSNFPSPPRIEVDLALSKLRNVYDLLYTISSDLKADVLKEQISQGKSTAPVLQEPVQTAEIPAAVKEPAPQVVTKPEPVSEPPAEPTIPVEKPHTEPQYPQQTVQEAVNQNPAQEASSVQPEIAQEKATIQEVKSDVKSKKEAAILAEKFEQDKSLNERIAGQGKSDLSSRLSSEPIDSIKRNIGINDRFLIIRELMNGDNEAYNEMVQKLDSCQNFNEAFSILEKKFHDNLEHEGARMLVNLARRKYISKDNV